MRFIKMHGIGNDYVYVNGWTDPVADPAALAGPISDRHTGVGGDGLIMVLPPQPGVQAHVRMRMFNADGSESEMCGNGVRCVCKLAYDHHVTPDIRTHNPMLVQTGRGVLSLSYTLGPDGKVNRVTVDMDEPILEPRNIPVAGPGLDPSQPIVDAPLWRDIPEPDLGLAESWKHACGLDERMTCVSMGNPHVVIYCRNVAAVPLDKIGPYLETQHIFPRRINVHFVQVVSPEEVIMRTWERGSGITLACGTGACAVAVAGVLTGRTHRRILAHLPGGDLQLEWHEAQSPLAPHHVLMTGSATEVFTGQWPDTPSAK